MPGITVEPPSIITRAPAGTRTLAIGPTSTMRLPRMTIVCPVLGAPPVPSIVVTSVSAITESPIVTTSRTRGVSVAKLCAGAIVGIQSNAIERGRSVFIAAPVNWSLYHEGHHHHRRQMLGDVTV